MSFWSVNTRLRHVGLDSLQALVTHGLLEVAKTCNLESYEHYVMGKKVKVKFNTVIHRMEDLIDLVHMHVWESTNTTSLGGN